MNSYVSISKKLITNLQIPGHLNQGYLLSAILSGIRMIDLRTVIKEVQIKIRGTGQGGIVFRTLQVDGCFEILAQPKD